MSEQIKSERFGCKLKRLREALDLTQAKLAQRSGVSDTVIAKLESGERAGLSAASLIMLARALDTSVDELIADTHFG